MFWVGGEQAQRCSERKVCARCEGQKDLEVAAGH